MHPHALFAHAVGPTAEITRILIFASLAVALAEVVWRLGAARKGYDLSAAAGTLGVALGHRLTQGLTGLAIGAVYELAWGLAPVHWPLGDWRTWAIGFGLVELAYYWVHRLSHEVRWMWATHAVHHSAEQLTFLSAIRLGWTGLLSGNWLVYVPLILLGFDPRLVLAILAVDLHYQFFLHTEAPIRLGPLERVLNTPAHHRVHHASNGPYLDRNFGGMVIVFDRLFGTFAAERPDEPLRFGLVRPVPTVNPFELALGEWRRLFADVARSRTFAGAWRAAFGRPA